ncbi:N-acetyltransferase [Thalassobaculum fulvum]|uniref:N-acetyltransferase n=1 Tax=Thalassobaculum fulvum TaxID=1633335 RepID=A0A918XUX4_9PROT|nr:GNAT family N-acetyltransferase [Thalassobaculum fulvum]GHD55529.1 N-acetyltransferase [Thalassobaculum fulvum]
MLLPDYPIETDRLRLRPFRAEDLDALHAIQSRPDVTRYLYWDARPLDDVRLVLADRLRQDRIVSEGDKLNLAMERRDTGALVGDVNLVWVSREHEQGEIGFVLHPDHHGRGLAREGAEVMLELGFAGLGLHRIVGRCDGRNNASMRVMEKLGMRREAHFRQNEIVKGERTDEVVYAMLADEWGGPPPGPA